MAADWEPEDMLDERLSEGDMPDLRRLEDLQRPGSQEHAEFMTLDVSDREAVEGMLEAYTDETHVVQSQVVSIELPMDLTESCNCIRLCSFNAFTLTAPLTSHDESCAPGAGRRHAGRLLQ